MSLECSYRKIECIHPKTNKNIICSLCLAGQQIDSIELLTSAVMNLSMSKLDEISEDINYIIENKADKEDVLEAGASK